MPRLVAQALPALVVCLSLCAGCVFQNLSPTERLKDAVYGLNSETRWGRMDLAIQRVVPAYRAEFEATHSRWGKSIRIADVDITNVETAGEDNESAVSYVSIRWYDARTLLMSDTVVAQTWKKVKGTYGLTGEAVRSGSPALLQTPPTPGGATSAGGEAPAGAETTDDGS